VATAEGKIVAASDGIETLPLRDLTGAVHEGQVARGDIAVRGGTRHSGAVRFTADGRTLFLVIAGPLQAARGVPAFVAPSEPRAETAEVFEPTADAAGAEVGAEVLFPDADDLATAVDVDDVAPSVDVDDVAPSVDVVAPAPFVPPRVVQFIFAADGEGRFTFVSPELGDVVGPSNAARAGHTWDDIADAFGFAGAPFAGTVRWPTGGGDTVAVTLAAAHDAGGVRGFGAIHLDDRAADVRVVRHGLQPVALPPVAEPAPLPMVEPMPVAAPPAPSPQPEDAAPAVEAVRAAAEDLAQHHDDADEAAQHSIERGAHRRPAKRPPAVERAAPPAPAKAASPNNVVKLGATPVRITAPAEKLSGTERDAFRRIAEALGARREDGDATPADPEITPAREAPKVAANEIDTRLLDRLPIGLAVFRDRRTIFANRTLLELLGYESHDAFADAGGAEAIFPGAEGLAGNIAAAGGKLVARRANGTTVPVSAWLHAVTWSGSTALMLSIAAMPERQTGDEDALTFELARSEARSEELSAILDTATDGVIVIDQRGKIGSMNRAAEALFGIEGSDYAGRFFTDLLADESQKAALDYLDGLAANGVASVLNDGREVIGRVPAGGLIPLFMTMGRIGTSDKFAAVLRDITHWKNVEAELIAARRAAEAANAQKSDFLAKISHEIRTPLNAIIGFSEVMMGEKFGPIGNERYRSYLHDIHVSGAHLLSLINDLLDLSKIEAGKVDLSFEAVPVNAAIQECVALMQPQANRERIIIRTSLGNDVPNVVADPRSFRQILLNLMSNAVKFTRAGGQVIVSSSLEASGEVVVRIRDTGIGMSDKDIETAMKPFRQVSVSREDREHGTGLGLPLTKALVEANRATFAIDSAVNQGTLVRITFPTTRVLAG
jgi:PAS domain S-box-containing protein